MSQAKLKAKVEAEANRPIAESLDGGYVGSSGKDELEAAMEPVAAAVPVSLHALDTSPVNSKIVVTEQGAILATPDFVGCLPEGDIAHALPEGARIQKIREGVFRSVQLDPAHVFDALLTGTATEAIDGFLAHFHGVQ